MRTALTIAGSDSIGGAGIQADIKTMLANGVYAMSAVTALTAQNTMGVMAIQNATPDFLRAEIDAVFTDIFPDAVKIGMVSEASLIEVIAECLTKYEAENVVLDPVMVSTSGRRLIDEKAIELLTEKLFGIATIVTPNIPETEVITGISIETENDMERAAEFIGKKYGCSVLVKGGHKIGGANDCLWNDGRIKWYQGERIDNDNTHGTGCTLSSAIASNLAKGKNVKEAVDEAKKYLSGALKAMLNLGKGNGPLDHGYMMDH